MHNFVSYFSRFSQGTCPRNVVNIQKSPLSPKRYAKRSTFFKMHTKKSTFSSEHVKKSTFAGKAPPPPNPDLTTGLLHIPRCHEGCYKNLPWFLGKLFRIRFFISPLKTHLAPPLCGNCTHEKIVPLRQNCLTTPVINSEMSLMNF